MAYFKNQNREINKRELIGREISYSYDNSSNENEQEAINRLHQAISNLNKMEKAIVSLMLEDVSQREIAHILGFTENNIRVKIHRIKERLKSILKPEVHGY